MTDFFYWNQSGTGFGVDKYRLDYFALSYVFSRKDNLFQDHYINRHDITMSDLKINANNQFNWGLTYIDAENSGWALTLQNISSDIQNGKNTVAFQYGVGPGISMSYTGDVELNRDNQSIRILDALDWRSSNNLFNGQAQVLYQKTDYQKGDDTQWFSIGSRASYIVHEHFKWSGEIGLDQIKEGDETRRLTKITLAPTLSLKGTEYYDRPELRLYYTYAYWNTAEQKKRGSYDPQSNFYNTSHGSNFGIQLENAW